MKLSGNAWIRAKAAYLILKGGVLRFISWSRFFSTTYYAYFSTAYRRERRAVLAGMLSHMKDLKGDASLFLLRRNVHRIEKGLVMPKRRPIFAAEYIGETVDYYKKCVARWPSDAYPAEVHWAAEVLHLYFTAVTSHPLVDPAREEFLAAAPPPKHEAVPYRRAHPDIPVTPEALQRLAGQRKSVRTYLQKPVPRELVDRAIKIAALSPSSCNRQPVHYRIYDEGPLLRDMAALPLGTVGFAENIPMICALTGDLSAYMYERDRHSIYVDGCLSAMLFMLALETVGLASCPLNWAEIDSLDRKLERLIGIPSHERCIVFIAIGYADPDGLVAYSEKKNLDAWRSYNQQGPSQS